MRRFRHRFDSRTVRALRYAVTVGGIHTGADFRSNRVQATALSAVSCTRYSCFS